MEQIKMQILKNFMKIFCVNKGFVNNIRNEYLSNDIILSASISAGLRSRLMKHLI